MKILLPVLTLLILSLDCFGQYDVIHYIPPMFSISSNPEDLGEHHILLSTNEVSSFNVTIQESNGKVLGVRNISLTNPSRLNLGDGFAATNIINFTQLNVPLTDEGLILTADRPFFANIRHISGSQGFSLTSKGSYGAGSRFRCGHMYSTMTGGDDVKSHMISVMATEDNTIVDFSDISPGVIFRLTPAVGNTSNDISVVLNKYESYVISAYMDEVGNFGNATDLNGVLVTSDKPIVVNSGTILGGSDLPGGRARDAGVDQIVPIELVGTEYVTIKGRGGFMDITEKTLVVADSDNTDIFLNGNLIPYATLNAGDFIFIPHTAYGSNDILYISTSEKVFVYHTFNSNPDRPNGVGLNFVPPLSCLGTNEVTISEVDFLGTPGIDIVSKVGANISVNDGAIILPAPIPIEGNSDWEVYSFGNAALVGDVHILSDKVINVSISTILGVRGSAGYFSGFIQPEPINPTISMESHSGSEIIVEGCDSLMVVLGKGNVHIDSVQSFALSIEGSAENGVDYTTIPNLIVIPSGKMNDTLFVPIYSDNISENNEKIRISVQFLGICGDTLNVSDSLIITDYLDMISIMPDDTTICDKLDEVASLNVIVENGLPPYAYLWSPTFSTNNKVLVAPEKETSYLVSITDKCNQTIFDSVTIFIQCLPDPVIFVPNAFTPDGDGINDYFFPKGYAISDENYTFYVFNRWGEVIHDSHNKFAPWNGTYKGEVVQDGVYVWKLLFKDVNDREHEKIGSVCILR